MVALLPIGISSLWVSHTGSASDWCALQEALYKCIDTIQYNSNGVKVLSLILTTIQNYRAVSRMQRPCDWTPMTEQCSTYWCSVYFCSNITKSSLDARDRAM